MLTTLPELHLYLQGRRYRSREIRVRNSFFHYRKIAASITPSRPQ